MPFLRMALRAVAYWPRIYLLFTKQPRIRHVYLSLRSAEPSTAPFPELFVYSSSSRKMTPPRAVLRQVNVDPRRDSSCPARVRPRPRARNAEGVAAKVSHPSQVGMTPDQQPMRE